MKLDDYPMILSPKDIVEILGLPQNQVYRLFKSQNFPSEKVKGKHIIPKPRFIHWMGYGENEAIKHI